MLTNDLSCSPCFLLTKLSQATPNKLASRLSRLRHPSIRPLQTPPSDTPIPSANIRTEAFVSAGGQTPSRTIRCPRPSSIAHRPYPVPHTRTYRLLPSVWPLSIFTPSLHQPWRVPVVTLCSHTALPFWKLPRLGMLNGRLGLLFLPVPYIALPPLQSQVVLDGYTSAASMENGGCTPRTGLTDRSEDLAPKIVSLDLLILCAQ